MPNHNRRGILLCNKQPARTPMGPWRSQPSTLGSRHLPRRKPAGDSNFAESSLRLSQRGHFFHIAELRIQPPICPFPMALAEPSPELSVPYEFPRNPPPTPVAG
jgi:hypothetical protein